MFSVLLHGLQLSELHMPSVVPGNPQQFTVAKDRRDIILVDVSIYCMYRQTTHTVGLGNIPKIVMIVIFSNDNYVIDDFDIVIIVILRLLG